MPQRKRLRVRKPLLFRLVILFLAFLALSSVADAMDRVVLRRDGREIVVDGRVLVEAQDGGLLVEAHDGVLWTVGPEEKVRHTTDTRPFEPLSCEEMTRSVLAELPEGFEVHETSNYLIFHNTSRAYAQWCGSLFERLFMGFSNYWSRKGVELSEPEFPLVAIVFADRDSYLRFTQAELGEAAESIIGYFSLRTNRMTMYDLTGTAEASRRRGANRSINQILARPEASRTVATIVHEATHQIAFNRGMHRRYSDCPLWFSEGVAVYFETPDLQSSRGWRNIGGVNRPRLVQFQRYLAHRPADSLKTLLQDDRRFRDPDQTLDAYAEAWALSYFLIRKHPKQYVAYLEMLSEKKPLLWDTPEERLEAFRKVFGELERLDAEFLRYMQRVR